MRRIGRGMVGGCERREGRGFYHGYLFTEDQSGKLIAGLICLLIDLFWIAAVRPYRSVSNREGGEMDFFVWTLAGWLASRAGAYADHIFAIYLEHETTLTYALLLFPFLQSYHVAKTHILTAT